MWFSKFWNIIKLTLSENPFTGISVGEMAKLNPEKIYVENVRSLLNVSTPHAKSICETAVRQGVFEECVEVLRPDGSAAVSATNASQLPEEVTCWIEEDGQYEEVTLPTATLRKNIFYRLNESEAH